MGAAPSMKPEHFCSGNAIRHLARLAHQGPFNEAGAFLLRKRCRADDRRATRDSFNEAGAFLLRKLFNENDKYPTKFPSMKPEHFCSGNMLTSLAIFFLFIPSMKPEHFCSGNMLWTSAPGGWMPTFNEAGAFLLRKRARNGREGRGGMTLQ